MKLNLFLSDALYTANKNLIARLDQNRKSGGNHIVIVPDRFTLSAEKDILRALNLSGSFDITVTSFPRLAKALLKDKANKVLSSEGAVMLMCKVISEIREELSFYKTASTHSGFASEMYAAITNVRNNCYSVEDLKKSVDELPEYLQEKTKDVIKIYENYTKKLSDTVLDGSTLLSEFARIIPESDYIAYSDIYLFDFFSFTAEQRGILSALIRCANSVNVAFLKGGEGHKNQRIYPQKEYERLISLATSNSIKCEIEESLTAFDAGRKRVACELFSYGEKEKTTGGEGIVVYEAQDRDDEVLFLARSIKKLVREGYRYRDISVLAGDIEGMSRSLKRVFSRHEIPYFADKKTVLATTPLARYVLSNIESGINGADVWEGEEIASNPYFGVEYDSVRAYSQFVLAHSISYLTEKSFKIGKNHPLYEKADEIRRLILDKKIILDKKADAISHVKRIREFIERESLDKKCDILSQKQSEQGDEYASSCTEQSLRKFNSVLEQMEKVLSTTELDREEFLAILNSAVNEVKVSFIPMFVDSVYVGGASESRFTEGKVLFIVNTEAGKLPLESARDGILGDDEERALKRVNIDLSPTAVEASFEEKTHLLQLMLMPKERLFITYVKGEEVRPSDMVLDIKEMFSDLTVLDERKLFGEEGNESTEGVERALSYLASDRVTAEYYYAFSQKEGAIYHSLRKILGKDDQKWEKKSVEPIPNAKEVFFPNHTSISQITSYFRCPYQHYFDRALGVKKVETGTSASLAGSFIHAVLELGIGKWIELGYPKVESKIFDQIVEDVLSTVEKSEEFAPYKGEKYASIRKRLDKEGRSVLKKVALASEISDYKPVEVEYDFGRKETVFLETETVKIKLDGKIDRIDQFNNKSVLIDYKTGSYPTGATDVYYGKGVQLPVYMATLDQKGRETKGAFYYPLSADYVKQDKVSPRLKGNILGTELSAFDKTFSLETGSKYIEMDVKGKGEKTELKTDGAEIVCDERTLQALKDYSVKVCERAVDEMARGNITPSPLNDGEKSPCEKCVYNILCSERKVKTRAKRTVKNADIVAVMQKENGNEVD